MSLLRMIYLALVILSFAQLAMVTAEVDSPWVAVRLFFDFRTEHPYFNKTGDGSPRALEFWLAAAALCVWIVAETWVRRNWWALVAIPATFLVGLSCGLPLYLFLRTRPVG
ncbi:MAG: DUF2834 domain-containing protein [Rhodobacteraceae bacterium]|nr:DUF2834 domain-containing protein [Paracoccaceae bacterium]